MSRFLQIVLALIIGLLLAAALSRRLYNSRQDQLLHKSVETLRRESPELITVRYRIHTSYCLDREDNRIQIGSLGFWKVKSAACWQVKSEVMAGYRWENLEFKRQGKFLKVSASAPEILGVDFKAAELIYSSNWANLDLNQKDFIARTREETLKTAKELGILDDAETRLDLTGNLLASRFGLEYPPRLRMGSDK